MSHKKASPRVNKKFIVPALIVLMLAGGSFLYLFAKQKANNANQATDYTEATDTINFEPPTEEDRIRAEQNKQAILDREQQLQGQQPTSEKKEVKPVITYAGQYGSRVEVGGYITSVYEDGGTCMSTFSQGASTLTKSVGAVKGATSVDCPVMEVGNEEFPQKGFWTVVLSYSSPAASGSSEPKQVEVK